MTSVISVSPLAAGVPSTPAQPQTVAAALAAVRLRPGTAVTITDTSANIQKNWDALLKIANNVGGITQSDPATALTLTAAQYQKSSALLGKVSTDYSLAVTEATAANATTIAGNARVASVTVLDTTASITANFEALKANDRLTSITQRANAGSIQLTAAQFESSGAVLAKIRGAYNLALTAATVDQAVSYTSNLNVKSVAIVDTTTEIAENLDGLKALGLRIKEIRTSGADPLVVSAERVKTDALVIGKIYSNYQLAVVNASSSQLAALATNKKVVTIDVVDTAANIGKNLALLQKLGDQVKSVKVNDGSGAVGITADQLALGEALIGKFQDGYTLAVRGARAADALALAERSTVATIAVSDTSANIAANLADLRTNAKLAAITQTGTPAALTMTADDLGDNADVLAKITGSYSLSVTGVTAATAKTLAANARVTALSVTDTAAQITANIEDLNGLGKRLRAVTQTDAGAALTLSQSQFARLGTTLAKVTGGYQVDVTGVSAANAAVVAASAQVRSVSVSDTGAAIAARFDALRGLGDQLGSITQSDDAALAITAEQWRAGQALLGKVDGDYTLAVRGARAAEAQTLLETATVASLTVVDSSANIAANLDDLRANTKLGSITQSGATTPLGMTATQLAANTAVLGKVAGTYSLAVTEVAAGDAKALVAGNNKVATVAVKDAAAALASNLDDLAGLGTRLTTITQSDPGTSLTLTQARFEANGATLAKITGGYGVNITAAAAASAAGLAANVRVRSVSVADGAAQLGANFDTLKSLGSVLAAVTQSDAGPVAVTAAQLGGADALLGKFTTAYTLAVSGAGAAEAKTLAASNTVATLTVVDSSASIAANFDDLAANTKLTAITQSGATSPLALSATQLATSGALLDKVVGSYSLAVSAVKADDAKALVEGNSKIASIAIDDSAAEIAANIEDLNLLGRRVSGIIQSDAGEALTLTQAKFAASTATLARIAGGYSVNVTEAGAAGVAALASNSVVRAVSVKDGGALLASNFDVLRGLGAQLATVTQTDSAALVISAQQFRGAETLLAKFAGAYTVDVRGAGAAEAQTLSAQSAVTSLTVADTSASIASNFDALVANTKLAGIAQTGTREALALTVTQYEAGDATLALINGGYSLALSGATVADALSLPGADSAIASIAVSDTAANVTDGFDALAGVDVLGSVSLTGAATTLALTHAQYQAGTELLARIGSRYDVAVADVAVANVEDVLADTHVASLTVKDDSAAVSAAFDDLVALGATLSGVTVTNPAAPLSLGYDQWQASSALRATINGGDYLATVADVPADQAATLAALDTVSGLTVLDAANNIAYNWEALKTAAASGALVALAVNDEEPIRISAEQEAASADLIAKFVGAFEIATDA